jgi:hypothetical protein
LNGWILSTKQEKNNLKKKKRSETCTNLNGKEKENALPVTVG